MLLGDIGSFVAEAQRAIDDKVSLPAGYLTTWGGQFRLQQQANARLAIVVPVTLIEYSTGFGRGSDCFMAQWSEFIRTGIRWLYRIIWYRTGKWYGAGYLS